MVLVREIHDAVGEQDPVRSGYAMALISARVRGRPAPVRPEGIDEATAAELVGKVEHAMSKLPLQPSPFTGVLVLAK